MRFASIFLLILASIGFASAVAGSGFGSAEAKEGIIMEGTDVDVWAQMVGMPGKQAVAQLEQENPNMTIQLVPFGSMVTMDYREDRIRVFVDEQGNVSKPPRVG